MRVFAALPLPPAAAAALAAALDPLRAAHPRFRWVDAAGFHLTLHFFGEVDARGAAAISSALASPSLRGPAVAARLGPAGQFPPRGMPRVAWVGLRKGAEEARAIWDALMGVISPLGWTPDPRGFTPHVTVGRAGREPEAPDLDAFVPPAVEFAFTEVVLFESRLERGGARYVPLARTPREGSAA